MAVFEYPQFSEDEIIAMCDGRADYNTGTLSVNRPPFIDGFAGRRLALAMDNGATLGYDFADIHAMTLTIDAGAGGPSERPPASGQENRELIQEPPQPGPDPRQPTGSPCRTGASSLQPEPPPTSETFSGLYYEALQVDDGVFLLVYVLAHTRPRRAHVVSLDLKQGLATVFFCRIGNGVSTREVHRDIVFGYVSMFDGQPYSVCPEDVAPTARHSLTTDIVGAGIIWTYSPTFSIQHIYGSQWHSCFVDFNTFYGGLVLASPANYVKLNDHIYIYSWLEVGGAGVQGFALMNLYTMHDVGCFFGINGSSQFECYTFGAFGKHVGTLANFDIAAAPEPYAKPHMRPYREAKRMWEGTPTAGAPQPIGAYQILAGRRLQLVFDDGTTCDCDFRGAPATEAQARPAPTRPATVAISSSGASRESTFESTTDHTQVTTTYDALPIDDQVVLVTLALGHDDIVLALDLEMNLCTMVELGFHQGQVTRHIRFGVIHRDGLPTALSWRHHFTRDLVGRSFAWEIDPEHAYQHIYAAPNSMAHIALRGDAPGALACADARYIRLNEHLYIASCLESLGHSAHSLVLMNLHTMHGAGTFLGYGGDAAKSSHAYIARGYDLGRYETKELFRW
ncbi:MAG: hypothetical protein LBR77_12145 [Lachnospiraceae bacterium]|nr:hypothetical protein [Lachnospiraceae bacterium]